MHNTRYLFSSLLSLSLSLAPAVCGSSFDSYNSFGLNPLGYNSQASFNASSQSFNTNNTTVTASSLLLDHHHHHSHLNFGAAAQSNVVSGVSGAQLNLPSSSATGSGLLPGYGSTGNSSPYATTTGNSPYSDSSSTGVAGVGLDAATAYDNMLSGSSVGLIANSSSSAAAARAQSSMMMEQMHQLHMQQHGSGSGGTLMGANAGGNREQQQQQLVDDQLMSKVSQMSLAQVTQLLEQKQRELSATSRIIRDQIASSKEIISVAAATTEATATTTSTPPGSISLKGSGRELHQDTEEFC